jgi:hypothetical protein
MNTNQILVRRLASISRPKEFALYVYFLSRLGFNFGGNGYEKA